MSGTVPELCRNLNSFGVEIIYTDTIEGFLPFEASHADMEFLRIDTATAAVLDLTADVKKLLQKLYKTFYIISLGENLSYPNNVALNHLIVGKYVLGNKKAVTGALMSVFRNKGLEYINVRQGYAKCSAALINQNAIITADESIYSACLNLKIDTLKISPGNIILPGTDYGFIGGCCGKISDKDIVFTGNIKLHPDYENIKSFCSNYNVTLHSLSSKPLTDIGGIIPIN